MEMICDCPTGGYVRPRIGCFITWPAKATCRNSYPETAFFLFSVIKLPPAIKNTYGGIIKAIIGASASKQSKKGIAANYRFFFFSTTWVGKSRYVT